MIVTSYFEVPALIEDRKEIVPAVQMGMVLQFKKDKEGALRAVDYLKRVEPPTLAEERHAYFDTKSGQPMAWSYDNENKIYVPERPDDWLSPEFRQSIADTRGKGEWTSTFKQPRQPNAGEAVPEGYAPVTIINFNRDTDRVWLDKKAGIWRIEYASKNAVDVLEPANGWTLSYVPETGYPGKTSQNRKDAEIIFGAGTSYFYAAIDGLRAVLRAHALNANGPFYVNANYEPGNRNSNIGARSCRSSVEQGSENLATPQKLMYELRAVEYSQTLDFLQAVGNGSASLSDAQKDARALHRKFSRLKPRK